MNPNRIYALGRQRYLLVTITAAAVATICAIFLVGAPPIPAVVGVAVAVSWLIWRAPAA
ncbi:MAG TPA: hypothetical protein VKE70_19110 [Candidatus Solibacter sp.]|nr:hypothetical protein [Candidatus Solibacter sp.]